MRIGYQVGPYIFEQMLGSGGMAEVWLARHSHLDTKVAIKFLQPQLANVPEVQQRFLNEGKRQSALNHPNIVKVYGFENMDGQGFLVLQYLDGHSLEDRIARNGRRPLPFADVERMAAAVLDALDHAHRKEIVHRDVKPSNILLDSQGNPHLGDFGLVLAMNDQRITRTGTVMGTAFYMSPEQIQRPKDIDHRSDIYSFGCVLYEMLCGKTPFESAPGDGDTDFNVKLAHVSAAPVPLRQVNPDVPPAVEAVVMRCLAKGPEHRFSNCAEVREALLNAFRGVMPPAPSPVPSPVPPIRKTVPPTPPPPPKPLPKLPVLALAGVLLVLAGGFGAYKLFGPKPAKEEQPVVVVKNDDPPVVKNEDPPVDPPPVTKEESPSNKETVNPPVVKKKDLPVVKKEEKKDRNVDPPRKQEPPVDEPVVVRKDDPPPVKKEDPPVRKPTVPAIQNARMQVELLTPISTQESKAGQEIRAKILDGQFANSLLIGRLNKVKPGTKQDRGAEIEFVFHTLRSATGESRPVDSDLISIVSVPGKKKSKWARMAGIIGAGAAIGAVIGKAKGAMIGAGAGAGAALTINKLSSKENELSYDAGSVFAISVSDRGQ